MSPMAFTALLMLLVLGAGKCDMGETTAETIMTDTTTTETTTTDTTTTETTTETTATPTMTPLNITKNTTGISNQTSAPSHPTVSPTTGNTTNIQFSNSSAGNTTAKSTVVPTFITTVVSHANATTNNSSWITPINTNPTNSSSAAPTSPVGAATGIPVSSTRGNGSSSPQVTSQGSTAPTQTPPAVVASSSAPRPSRAPVLLPTGVQLLRSVPLSFRIINRSFNESLRDPTSKDYRTLSHTVLTMYQYVFGCASCVGRQTYKGCSELQFSQGSVEVQSVLIFGHGNETVTSTVAEQQLRKSLDHNGFIMDLQLASIWSTEEVTPPAPAPAVPDWAIALLVLVCILLLLSILTCFLMTTCTCRRKSRGKLDLLSTKDSYHPMAEYPPYQSHGRYASPNSKPNPYSQVAGTNGAGTGTFTYTNPAATSDNL